jgi:hypothetical protein
MVKSDFATFSLDHVEDGVLLIENGSLSFINKSLLHLCSAEFRSKIETKECIGLSISEIDIFGQEEENKEFQRMMERVWDEKKEEHQVFRFYEENGAILLDVIVDCIPYQEDTMCCILHPQRNYKEDDLQTKLERLEVFEVFGNNILRQYLNISQTFNKICPLQWCASEIYEELKESRIIVKRLLQ